MPVGDNEDNSRIVPPATVIPLNSEVEKPSGADDGGRRRGRGGGGGEGTVVVVWANHPIILPMSRFAL